MLAASHALVAWAGFAWQSRPVDPAPTGTPAAEPPKPVRPPRPARKSGWKGTTEQRFEAALRQFGPDTDFVRRMALLTANTRQIHNPEIDACLMAWLEHDAVAAIRWLALDQNSRGRSSLQDEPILFHLERHGEGEIVRLMNAAPEARWAVLGAMYSWMKDHQPADLLRLAGQLEGSENRIDLLRFGIREDTDLVPYLKQVRSLLDERGAVEFFWLPSHDRDLRKVAAAAKQAGFPQQTVDSLLQEAARREQRKQTIAGRLAAPNRDSQGWIESTREAVRRQHPDLDDWSADFADRDLPAETVLARLLDAEPALHGHQDEATRIVFDTLFAADAGKATRWLIDTRPDDWQVVLLTSAESNFHDVRAEQFWRLATGIPDPPEALWDKVSNKFGNWLRRDPDGFLVGIDSIAPGPRRDTMIAREVVDSRLDPAVAEALLQRIDDSAVRAKAEKQISAFR